MTKHARLVLEDCESSLAEFHRSEPHSMRRRWLATISLLRAVGHVLGNVDRADLDQDGQAVIDQQFSEIKKTEIFKAFIDKERNNILKEYRFAVRANVTIAIPRSGHDPSPDDVVAFAILPLTSGPFKGQHPTRVVEQAIAFWRSQLDEVDRRVAALVRKGS